MLSAAAGTPVRQARVDASPRPDSVSNKPGHGNNLPLKVVAGGVVLPPVIMVTIYFSSY